MARLSTRIRPDGAIAEITIGPSRAALASGRLQQARMLRVPALFDTGADITVLHSGLAEQIGIIPHDRVPIAGLHDATATCNVYDVNLGFVGTEIEFFDLTVVESSVVAAPRVQVLIGRSVLWKGVFTFDGPEQTFCFEIPDSD